MLQQLELNVQRVLHLVQLLRTTDHVRNHHLSLSPRQVLVHPMTLLLQHPSQVVSQPQQLSETHLKRLMVLLLNLYDLLNSVKVVCSHHYFSPLDILHYMPEISQIIGSCSIEVIHNRVLVFPLLSQFSLLNDIGSSDQLSPKKQIFPLIEFNLIHPPLHRPL